MSRLDLSLLTQPQQRTPLPASLAPEPLDYSGLGKGLSNLAENVLSAEERQEAENKQNARLELQMMSVNDKQDRLSALDEIGKDPELTSEKIKRGFEKARRSSEQRYDALSAKYPELSDMIDIGRAGAVLDIDISAREFELGYQEDQAKIGFEGARNNYLENFNDDRVESAAQLNVFVRQENEDVQESIYLSDLDKNSIQNTNKRDMLRGGMASLLRQGKADEARKVLLAPDIDAQTRALLERDLEAGLEDLQTRQQVQNTNMWRKVVDSNDVGVQKAQQWIIGATSPAILGLEGTKLATAASQEYMRNTSWLGQYQDIYDNGGSFAKQQLDNLSSAVIYGQTLFEAAPSTALETRLNSLRTLDLDAQQTRRGAAASHRNLVHRDMGLISTEVGNKLVQPVVDRAFEQRDIHIYASRHMNRGTSVEPYVYQKYSESLKTHDYEFLYDLFTSLDPTGFRVMRDSYPEGSYERTHIELAALANSSEEYSDLNTILQKGTGPTGAAHKALLRFNNRPENQKAKRDAAAAVVEEEGSRFFGGKVEEISAREIVNLYDMRLSKEFTGTVIDENGNIETNQPVGTALLRYDLSGVNGVLAASVARSSSRGIAQDQAYDMAYNGVLVEYTGNQIFVQSVITGRGVRELASTLDDSDSEYQVEMRGRNFGIGFARTDGVLTALPMPKAPGLSRQSIPEFNSAIQAFHTSNSYSSDAINLDMSGASFAAVHETFAVEEAGGGLSYAVPVRSPGGALLGYYMVERETQVGTTEEEYGKGDVKPLSVQDFGNQYGTKRIQYESKIEGQAGLDISEGLDDRLTWTTGDRMFANLPTGTQANMRQVATQNLKIQFPKASPVTIQMLVPEYLGQHRWRMGGPTWLERTLGEDMPGLNTTATGLAR